MPIELSDQEKYVIVNQHIKNCVTNIYNLQVSVISEQALDVPNETLLSNLNAQINNEVKRQMALELELASLNISGE